MNLVQVRVDQVALASLVRTLSNNVYDGTRPVEPGQLKDWAQLKSSKPQQGTSFKTYKSIYDSL